MAGWMLFALLVTLVVLRALGLPEAHLFRGAAAMGIGVWLIWIAAVPAHSAFRHMPDMLLLLVGMWLVVKGALRFASY
jgi:hypothetical protein